MPSWSNSYGVTPLEARAITSVLSGRLGVNIAAGDGWYYNFEDNCVYYGERDLYRLSEKDVVANIMHEVGHAKYSVSWDELDFGKVEKAHENQFQLLVNLVEDFRIEDILRDDYPYAKDYLPEYSFKTAYVLKSAAERMSARRKEMPKIIVYFLQLYARIGGYKLTRSHDQEHKKIKPYVDKTLDWAIEARYKPNEQALVDILSQKIYPEIKELFIEDSKTESMIKTFKEINRSVRGNYKRNRKPRWTDPSSTIKPLVPKTTATLRKALQSRSFDKFAGKYRSGKLNNARLYKFGTNDYRLFQRKVAAKMKQDALALLIDTSGSMRGGGLLSEPESENNIFHAIAAAMLFARCLDKIGMRYLIGSFNEAYNCWKGLDELGVGNKTKVFKNINSDCWGNNSGGTNNALGIHKAKEQLAKAKGNKVIFSITDGKPNTRGKYDTREEIERAENLGIKVVGFGIGKGVSAVPSYYNRHVLVRQTQQLPSALKKSLIELLKKGAK